MMARLRFLVYSHLGLSFVVNYIRLCVRNTGLPEYTDYRRRLWNLTIKAHRQTLIDHLSPGQYYRDMLLTPELLPAIRSIAGDVFVFQLPPRQCTSISRSWHMQSTFCTERHPNCSSLVLTCGQPTVMT